jgi:hypothetical protein
MANKVITIEDRDAQFQSTLDRIMRMVPDKDKTDPSLKRLLAFRLKIDGEAGTSEYLIQKIRDMIQCRYTGSFYEFIKDDRKAKACQTTRGPSEPLRVI